MGSEKFMGLAESNVDTGISFRSAHFTFHHAEIQFGPQMHPWLLIDSTSLEH